ncbi:MAG: HAD-IIA family hydrolase [Dermatophilaceae bacterium]
MTADSPLLERYRALVCDLDGVVYRGHDAVPYAVGALSDAGLPVVYATNNASRTPEEVATHLRSLGLRVAADHVVNSSMAGAAEVARRFPAGSAVLAVGGAGVAVALRAAGLDAVTTAAAPVVAVLQGYGPQVCAADLAEAAYAIQAGALWVATNDDLTLPTDRGIAPGNGSLVQAVGLATGIRPLVMGKPQPPLYLMASALLGLAEREVLGIGDRLETDVEGATAAGMDCVLVLTGVHDLRDAALAAPRRRPRYVLRDLRGLSVPYAEPRPAETGFVCGTSSATVAGDRLLVESSASGDPLDAARACLAAIWATADRGAGADALLRLADQLPVAR